MNQKKTSAISRREFARRAAMTSATALLPPTMLTSTAATAVPEPLQQSDAPKLTPESQTEADQRLQAILAQYGSRLSEAQKADLRRLNLLAQPPLDHLRAYTTQNGDGPALYLKPLIEREKKSSPNPAGSNKTAGAVKQNQ
jgi:hypothetical protein